MNLYYKIFITYFPYSPYSPNVHRTTNIYSVCLHVTGSKNAGLLLLTYEKIYKLIKDDLINRITNTQFKFIHDVTNDLIIFNDIQIAINHDEFIKSRIKFDIDVFKPFKIFKLVNNVI